jgi:hypothetical protein
MRISFLVAGLHKVGLDEDLLAFDAAEDLVLNELERLVDVFGAVVAFDEGDGGDFRGVLVEAAAAAASVDERGLGILGEGALERNGHGCCTDDSDAQGLHHFPPTEAITGFHGARLLCRDFRRAAWLLRDVQVILIRL